MGVSTDSIVAYGVNLGESIPTWMQEKFGKRDSYDLNKVLEKHGLSLIMHCSDECPMYVLAIAKSEVSARRGYPKSLPSLVVEETWATTWEPVKQAGEPKWLLFSWWG